MVNLLNIIPLCLSKHKRMYRNINVANHTIENRVYIYFFLTLLLVVCTLHVLKLTSNWERTHLYTHVYQNFLRNKISHFRHHYKTTQNRLNMCKRLLHKFCICNCGCLKTSRGEWIQSPWFYLVSVLTVQ